MFLYFLQSYEEILTNEKKNRKKIKRPTKVSLFRGAWRSRTALAGFADRRLNRSSNAPFSLSG